MIISYPHATPKTSTRCPRGWDSTPANKTTSPPRKSPLSLGNFSRRPDTAANSLKTYPQSGQVLLQTVLTTEGLLVQGEFGQQPQDAAVALVAVRWRLLLISLQGHVGT